MNSDELIIELYEARRDARTAKTAHRALVAKLGQCQPPPDGDLCYEGLFMDPIDWCDVCKAKQPAWEAYHKAVNRQAAALRRVLAHGKQLSAAFEAKR